MQKLTSTQKILLLGAMFFMGFIAWDMYKRKEKQKQDATKKEPDPVVEIVGEHVNATGAEPEKELTDEQKAQVEEMQKMHEQRVASAKEFLTAQGVSVEQMIQGGKDDKFIMVFAQKKGWQG